MRLLSNHVARVAMAVLVAASVLDGERAVASGPESGPALTADNGFSALPGSFKPTTDVVTGEFSSSQMAVYVVLAPRNESELSDLLTRVYNQKGDSYRHWLGKGEFASRFAPSDAQVAAVSDYLRASGLRVEPSSSPFLLRASGPSAKVAAAFRTTIRNYRNPKGIDYFSNASAIHLPASLSSGVLGVVGLSNTVRMQSQVVRSPLKQLGANPMIPTSCEAPYPTEQQIANAILGIVSFPNGYGAGPGCNGLSPSQDNSIYGAPSLGPSGQGAGIKLGLFELSAYQHSDIVSWAQNFYGAGYTPPLVDITVDGGPLSPICPAGDTCPANFNGYSGDIEVDADIEMQLAIAPAANQLLVYNAPNDFSGQTQLDEWTKIANDNIADVVSSSWAICENDVSAAYVQAENLIFQQMALQGQSVFGAEGDTGAFSCLRSDGTTILNVLDPPAQPWVTSVGGTSFESFNPGTDPSPSYPTGVETVWNPYNLCNNTSPNEDGLPGLEWCAGAGAGGGGNSQYWGRPAYQTGPEIDNPYTTYGNGSTQCSLAARGAPCREVPDVSANADAFTPYAEYCTGSGSTPYSVCGTFSNFQTPPGWFGIGGTSLSSPLWSAVIADLVGLNGRIGNANPLLYSLYNLAPNTYFNDITGTTNNNGYFPTTIGYDLATGIGTPKMAAIITVSPSLIPPFANPATLSKVFGVASIPLGGTTSLSFTIQNPNSTPKVTLTEIAFSDPLPAGLVISTPNGLSGSCGGGTITATANTAVFSLSGASLAWNGSCSFSVNVTGITAGAKNNTTGHITSVQGGTGLTASASLAVVAPPTISKAFGPSTILVGGTTTLTFTLTNPSANSVAESGVAFSDTLTGGLQVASPPSLVNNCGGTFNGATSGSTALSVSGAAIPVNSSCTISLNITSSSYGIKSNVTGKVSSNDGCTGTTSNIATLIVDQAPHITSANYVTFTKGVMNSFTITTTAFPVSGITLSPAGSLPAGVMFVDNGNGTATLSGKPTVSGLFSFWVKAVNGVSPQALQSFTLTVH